MFGDKVLSFLVDIERCGVDISKKTVQGEGRYVFGDSHYRVEVILNPDKWLGLTFTVPDSKLVYAVNTDLYDVMDPKNKKFITAIESDVLEFLEMLKGNQLKIAKSKSKTEILIPRKEGAIILKRGRILSSVTRRKSITDIDTKKKFVTFPLALS